MDCNVKSCSADMSQLGFILPSPYPPASHFLSPYMPFFPMPSLHSFPTSIHLFFTLIQLGRTGERCKPYNLVSIHSEVTKYTFQSI